MARILDLAVWRKFLKSQGLVLVRTKGGHEIWDFPDGRLKRPIAFSCHDKQIAIFQMGTNLQTLGLTMDDLDEWLSQNKKKEITLSFSIPLGDAPQVVLKK